MKSGTAENAQERNWFPDVPFEHLVIISEEINALKPPWDGESFCRAVRNAFAEGLLAQRLAMFQERLHNARIPQRHVADVLDVSEAAVSQWFSKGEISAKHLNSLMHHFRDVLFLFPKWQTTECKELIVGGYARAMFFIQHDVLRIDTRKQISRPQFALLEYSLKNVAWQKGNRKLGADQILKAAADELATLKLNLYSEMLTVWWLQDVMATWCRPYLYATAVLSLSINNEQNIAAGANQ